MSFSSQSRKSKINCSMEAGTGFTSYKIKQIDFKYREISDKLPQISDQIELFQFNIFE